MPRGRPKGSKNKRQTGPVRYSIGSGTQYEFPIVREGNVSNHIAVLTVGSESFAEALKTAVAWAWNYSIAKREKFNDETLAFWPLVRRKLDKFYVKRVGGIGMNCAWIESKTEGFWIPIIVLEAL